MGNFKIAEQIAGAYADNNSVEAVMLAGSVARGMQDRHSDIEIYVLWSAAPSDRERKDVIGALNGEILTFFDYEDEEWSESYRVKGIKIEVSSFLTSSVSAFISLNVDEGNEDLDAQAITASIVDGIPLNGAEIIHGLKEKAGAYPEALRRNMIESQLEFSSRWSARNAYIEREDFFIYQKLAWDTASRILMMLHGLNRLYVSHPGFKWIHETIRKMEIKPPNLEERIRTAVSGQTRESVIELESLLAETGALITRHLPGIDIGGFLKEISATRVSDKEKS
ncbi:DUF4037 domain-containing protein [Peribacillus sp. SCS-37]|uniref:DUF4037 domain-containing protein n=1 Tax=Paraperibacillus esterisolvens TaxID=3115296 RepID=UPI0039067D08